jgi:hypothetical protein
MEILAVAHPSSILHAITSAHVSTMVNVTDKGDYGLARPIGWKLNPLASSIESHAMGRQH